METKANIAKPYRHRSASRESQICRNQACSRIQNEIRNAVSGATEVHSALCAPEWQRIGNVEIATRIVPLRHVGGDFVCSVKAGDSTIAILGDLMGKGLPAAMWITHIIDLVHRATENFENLPRLMERLNTELIQSRVRAPLTSAFVVVIDGQSGKVSCSSAGHPPSILVRSDKTTELLTEGGPLLGVFAGARYQERSLRLQQGDAIASFSDGLIEGEGQSHEQCPLTRAALNLARHAALSARQKLAALLEAAEDFSGGHVADDISAMVVQHA